MLQAIGEAGGRGDLNEHVVESAMDVGDANRARVQNPAVVDERAVEVEATPATGVQVRVPDAAYDGAPP